MVIPCFPLYHDGVKSTEIPCDIKLGGWQRDAFSLLSLNKVTEFIFKSTRSSLFKKLALVTAWTIEWTLGVDLSLYPDKDVLWFVMSMHVQ